MGLFDDDFFDDSMPFIDDPFDDHFDSGPSVNPATGWPMIEGTNIDVAGNMYGFSDEDYHQSDLFNNTLGDDNE